VLVKQRGYSKKYREIGKKIVKKYMFKKSELKVQKRKKRKKTFVFFAKNDDIKTILRYIS